MACPEERLIAFLAGELTEEEERDYDRHLLTCEPCWRAVAADRLARAALEPLRQTAPVGLADRVAMAVAAAPSSARPRTIAQHRPSPTSRAHRPLKAVVVVAAAVAVGLPLGLYLDNGHTNRSAPQVEAVVAMISPEGAPSAPLRAGEHMVIARQPLMVHAYVVHGGEAIVATSVKPFPLPDKAHLLAGSSDRAWMATEGHVSVYGVNRGTGKMSMFVAAAMPMAQMPEVAAELHLT